MAKTREIILHCPADVQAAVREIFVTANDDEAINSKLETWLEGRNGAALSARCVYGNPITSAAVDVVDADTSAIVSKVKAQRRGKWQEVGLAVAKRLMAQHGGGVSIDAWREECHAAGMVRQNQHRVLEALGQHGDITLKGGVLHVVTS